MFALLLIAAAILPVTDTVLRDTCERFERNNFFDGEGRLVFTQLVAWDAERVFFWRMAKDGALPVERDHVHGGWLLRWNDSGPMREVRARSYEETWTQHDAARRGIS
jgi:hypothetical protein